MALKVKDGVAQSLLVKAQKAQSQSRLLLLPAELLHRIFILTLTGHTLHLEATYSSTTGMVFRKRAKWPEGTNRRPKGAWVKKWQKEQLNRLLALPLTCRSIHKETLSILYAGVNYSFDLDRLWRVEPNSRTLGDGTWLSDLRPYLLAMRSLNICYGPMRDYKLEPKSFFLNLVADHAVNLEDLTVGVMLCDWSPGDERLTSVEWDTIRSLSRLRGLRSFKLTGCPWKPFNSHDKYGVMWNTEHFVLATLPAVEAFLMDFVFLKRGAQYGGKDGELKEMKESEDGLKDAFIASLQD